MYIYIYIYMYICIHICIYISPNVRISALSVKYIFLIKVFLRQGTRRACLFCQFYIYKY